MSHFLIVATTTAADVATAASPPSLYEWYDRALRAPLFTGSIALTGLLFTTMSFFVVNLKTGIYGEKAYRTKIREARQFNHAIEVYGPLRRFTKLTLLTIVLAFASAVLQMTVGLIEADRAVYVCLAGAGLAALSFVVLLVVIGLNINDLFADMEKDANDKMAKGE